MIVEKPLHVEKVSVGVIGSYFFENDAGKTVFANSEHYRHIFRFFFFFGKRSKQECATSHRFEFYCMKDYVI